MDMDYIVLDTDLIGFDKNCQSELLTMFTACRDMQPEPDMKPFFQLMDLLLESKMPDDEIRE